MITNVMGLNVGGTGWYGDRDLERSVDRSVGRSVFNVTEAVGDATYLAEYEDVPTYWDNWGDWRERAKPWKKLQWEVYIPPYWERQHLERPRSKSISWRSFKYDL
jgi:hypothetical protein